MSGTDAGVGRVVVVGVDGSTTSAKAVERAVREAAFRGAALHVVHVTPGPGRGERGACVLDAAADCAARVDRSVRVRTTLRSGSPVAALLDAARGAELVVVGTRRLGTDAVAACGSVSTRVAAGSAAPVVVVPPVRGHARSSTDVVVGVDGSDEADAALRFALEEARQAGGRVVAVCAWHPAPEDARGDPGARLAVVGAARDEATRTVRAAVDRVRVVGRGVDVAPLVVGRRPEQVLRDLGRGAAITVVGARGRADRPGTLLGPVVRDLLHRATGPVAVVHAAPPSAA